MDSKTLLENRLRELRADRGVSRQQLSNLTGIPLDTIKSWEYGKTNITIENLKILSEFYGVSIDYIAGITANPEINKKSDK